jgi:hypothetical protein
MGDASSYSVVSGRQLRRNPILSTDCLVARINSSDTAYPWYASQIGAGTVVAPNAGLVTVNHPGIVKLTSSGANSGALLNWSTSQSVIGGGECMEVIINITTLTGLTMRVGFHNSTSVTDAVDGCYFEIPATGIAVGKTANNSVRTTSAAITTLVINTWYRFLVVVNPTRTTVDFYIYNDVGVLLGTQQITTNIPGNTRTLRSAIAVTTSSAAILDLCHVDWIAMWYEGRSLQRG